MNDASAGRGLVASRSFASQSQWRLAFSRFRKHRLALVGLFGLVLIVGLFIVGPWISKYGIDDRNVRDRLQGPSWDHPFGTDPLGKDLFVKVMLGGRFSIRIGALTALVATVVGTFFGLLAGYLGRWVDSAVTQLTNVLLTVPALILLTIFSRRFGQSPTPIALILALLLWIRISRVVRSNVLQLREQDYVQAARAAGATNARIITRHILPNVVGSIVVEVTLLVGSAITLESTVSFLGLGVQPPTPTLGNIVYQEKGSIDTQPVRVLLPGLFVVGIVLFINFVGDGLRDALDPKTKVDKE